MGVNMSKKKPIIGILARPAKTSLDYDVYIAYEKIRKAIIKAGGIPISILPVDDKVYSLDDYVKEELTQDTKDDLKRILNLCDGVVFQGGSKWYSYDEFIASYVIENDIPTLAICLGMQLLSFIDSSSRPVLINTKIDHNQRDVNYVHDINIVPNTLLSDILKQDVVTVNSSHQYKVNQLKDFKICATSSDNVTEAIYHPKKKFILGVQFHPESMLAFNDNIYAYKIFKNFIDNCK